MITFSDSERLAFDEYRAFLTRTDLGSQYPKQDFEARVRTLLQNATVCITARARDGLLVGVCLGLTDFAYFLFLTDLGVDRTFVGQGIGRELVQRAHQNAGGEAAITITTISHEDAIGFYEKCGLRNQKELVVKYCKEWEPFTVT